MHLNLGFNGYTYLGALGAKPATYFTPANGGVGITEGRAVLMQQVGIGYKVQEHLRLQLTGVFGEYLTHVPVEPADAFAVAGVIPWAVFLMNEFWIGAGAVVAGRSSGVQHFDAGFFAATGWAFPIGGGFAISPLVQVLGFLYQRVSIAVTPVVSLSYKF